MPAAMNKNRTIDTRQSVVSQLSILSCTKRVQFSWWSNISQCMQPSTTKSKKKFCISALHKLQLYYWTNRFLYVKYKTSKFSTMYIYMYNHVHFLHQAYDKMQGVDQAQCKYTFHKQFGSQLFPSAQIPVKNRNSNNIMCPDNIRLQSDVGPSACVCLFFICFFVCLFV